MDRKRGSRSRSPQHKRQKVAHDATPPAAEADSAAEKTGTDFCSQNLSPGLLTDENVGRLRDEYANNEPFKYARVETLFQNDLLKKVKDECLDHLCFTEKETDIYRVSPVLCDSRSRTLFRSFTLCVCVCAWVRFCSHTPPPSGQTPAFSHDWTHLPCFTFFLHPKLKPKEKDGALIHFGLADPDITGQPNRRPRFPQLPPQ